jgi:hypothetical protein
VQYFRGRTKMQQILALVTLITVILGCGQSSETSQSKIVNGYVESPDFFSDDSKGLSFLLGFHLGDAKTKNFPDSFCSGFRYGYQTLITAAHCIEAQYPEFRERPPVIEITTGTGKPLVDSSVPVEITVHPDYTPDCLNYGGMCPDIAVIKLPDAMAALEIWTNSTDPAEIDLIGRGFPQGEAPMLAGFGCTADDFYLSGNCSRPTFKDLRYSVATGLEQRPNGRQDLGEYYFQVDGKNSIKQSFGIGSGDSGAPLFRKLPQVRTLRPGDVKRVIVDGIGIHVDSGFVETIGFDNLILDFAHPKVSGWLKQVLANDGTAFKDPETPFVIPGTFGICNPDLISSKPAEKPFNTKPWTVASLGGTVPEGLVETLNGLRNGRTSLFLGQCIGYVERKIAALEKLGTAHPSYDDLSILYQVARWEFMMLLEIAANSEDLDDQQVAILLDLHKAQAEILLDMQDAILSGTPLVSTGYDIYILYTGENVKGKVSDLEYNTTAALFFVPGIIKGAGTSLKLSAKTLETSARLAERIGRYGVKAGRLSQSLANAAMQVKRAESGYAQIIASAKAMGIQTAGGLRSFLRLRRVLEPACGLASQEYVPGGLERILQGPLSLIEGRAYAASGCGQLTETVSALIHKTFRNIAEDDLDVVFTKLRDYCTDSCNVTDFLGELQKLDLGLDAEKAMSVIEKLNLKSDSEIIQAFNDLLNAGVRSENFEWVVDTAKNIGLKNAEEIKLHAGVLERWSSSFKKLNVEKAEIVNAEFSEAAYLAGTKVIVFETAAAESFVRVHGATNQARNWVMRESDIQGLTAAQIAAKFNIPEVPTMLSRASIPSGVRMRTGIVGPNAFGSSSGAIQFEIMMPNKEFVPAEWFTKIRNI